MPPTSSRKWWNLTLTLTLTLIEGATDLIEEVVERDLARLKSLRSSRPASAVSSSGQRRATPEPKWAPKGPRKYSNHYPGSAGVPPKQAAYKFRQIDGAPRKSINIYK